MNNLYLYIPDEFKDKRVVVTRETKGPGEAIVPRFALEGASVATAARSRGTSRYVEQIVTPAQPPDALGQNSSEALPPCSRSRAKAPRPIRRVPGT